MELKEYLRGELEGVERGMKRVLDGLTPAELMWRPSCGCNSIGLILFHVARSEDNFAQARLQGKPQIWETEKWYLKLNVAESEAGAHYTVDQVNAFPVPEGKDLVAYFETVRAKTLEYLSTLTNADLDRKFSMPPFGDMTAASMFSLIVNHAAGHFGEMSYLRGMQRGLDK